MKLASVLLAVGCMLSAASAQWLDTTLYVPDSTYGLTQVTCAVYDSTGNSVYVAGDFGRHVLEIDGTTHEKVGRISVPGEVRSLCWNSRDDKIYAANIWDSSVTIASGATNQVLAKLHVGPRHGASATIRRTTRSTVLHRTATGWS